MIDIHLDAAQRRMTPSRRTKKREAAMKSATGCAFDAEPITLLSKLIIRSNIREEPARVACIEPMSAPDIRPASRANN